MYSNVLVPVLLDDSRNTDLALDAARALMGAGAQVTLLHVVEAVPVYVAEYIPVEVYEANRTAFRTELEELAQKLPQARPVLTDGRAGPRIVRWAEENGCDLIVIASHQPAFSDILLGSVAQHVVRHATCAVHVVR